ncbi:MAG: hypothetical protein ACLQGP_35190 [Isosphaeraceae bacterium]
MDQEPLVREWIDAARKLLDELENDLPIQAAFWLKEDEDSHWNLYIASERVKNGGTAADYGVVANASKTIDDPNLNLSRVTLIGIKDPLAQAALDMYKRYPTRIPIFRWRDPFGKRYVEGLYLYPQPVSSLSQ